MVKNKAQARRMLDAKFRSVDAASWTPPPAGWVRAIRDALGMTTRQLGRRLGVSAMAISHLERSERAGTVQLDTLRRAADALGCDVVYVVVPRDDLDERVQRAARARAMAELARVDRTMRLEAQGLNDDAFRRRLDEFAARLVDSSVIWDDVS